MQAKPIVNDAPGNGQSAVPAAVDVSSPAPAREFHNFVLDIEDLIKATTSLTGEDLARARARLNERLAAAKQSAAATYDEVAKRTRAAATQTDRYVHDQPWKAVGIGAAIGVLFGLLLARRA